MSAVLPDEEIDNASEFGFDDFSDALSLMVINPELQTPFTIAIHGEWGSGKTSLLKTVIKKLNDNPEAKVKTIWFNAWEFEKLSVPLWTVFVNRIASDLKKMSRDQQTKEKLLKIAGTIATITVAAIAKKATGLSIDDMKELSREVSNEIPQVESLREELSSGIELTLRENADRFNRIVIFIDDLDRCLPDQAVEVFESIKLFLNCENCVFVIGIDKDQIRKAFVAKYPDREPISSSYVEKFIQLQFELPRKTPDEVRKFLAGRAPRQLAEAPTTLDLISRFIEPNPRKIKRWLNSVVFLEELITVKERRLVVEGSYDMSLVSIWVFLKSFFPDFASRVEREPAMINLAIKVAKKQGSEEDRKRMGDFAGDKQLTDFLSALKDEYSENQLKDVIYLSGLAPTPENISRLPEDVLERLSNISPEEFEKQVTTLSAEIKISLSERIVARLAPIEDYKVWGANEQLCELLNRLVMSSTNNREKSQLVEKALYLMSENRFARWFLDSYLLHYLDAQEVKDMIVSNNYLDLIVHMFESSDSFKEAKELSKVINAFAEKITDRELKIIVESCRNNDQIRSSYGAQSNLKQLFQKKKESILPEDLDYLGKNGFV